MALSATNTVEKLLGNWLQVVQKYAWLFLLIALAFTVSNVFYIKDNLGINTDTADMLSEELDWRKNHIEYKKAFPQFSDNIAIVIESETPDQTQDATIALTERLKKEQQLFPSVFQIENSDFFRQNSLLYLDTEELEELADNLAAVQPFLAKLQQDQNIRGLFSVLTQALAKTSARGDQEVDLDRILNAIDQTVSAHLQNNSQRMSWHELMSGRETTMDDRRTVITVQPKLDYSKLLPGEPAIETLRSIVNDMQLKENYGVQVRLTGGVALAYEELDSVARGAKAGGLIALFAVAIILILGLRSLSLVIATLVTLIIGLIWTAAFATIAIGELNMISVAFMVLYIGLGVDFAIHLCLRYREQRLDLDQELAVRESGKHIGASLLLCAFTTAIGFYAFLPTAYSGVAELGLISGTGMFISLILSLTVLPALLTLLPYKPRTKSVNASNLFSWLQNFPFTHAKSITIAALIIGLISLITLPKIKFDHNPVHLMDPETESVQTFKDLLAESSRSPLSINIVETEISDLPTQLEMLETVDEVITINSFIPTDQEDKLAIIEDLELVMSLEEEPEQKLISDQERLQAINDFTTALKTEQPDQKLNKTLETLLGQNATNLNTLEQNLIASFPGRLRSLEESLEAEEITNASLPDDLSERWQSNNNFRIEVFSKNDLNDNQTLESFVNDVRKIAPDATGTPIINLEASDAVIKAFQQAFGLAILVITILLWLLLDKKTDSFLILATLILAGLMTCAVSVLLGIQFNFANIIALPLLLGIGVDSSIHILHRYRTALPESGLLLNTSTARAVLFSALTTACSFGNLAISPHQGTASMGVLLTIGLILTLFVTLIVLPALLTLADKKS